MQSEYTGGGRGYIGAMPAAAVSSSSNPADPSIGQTIPAPAVEVAAQLKPDEDCGAQKKDPLPGSTIATPANVLEQSSRDVCSRLVLRP